MISKNEARKRNYIGDSVIAEIEEENEEVDMKQ